MKRCAFLIVGICAGSALHAQTSERPATQSRSIDGDTFRFRDDGGRVLTVPLTATDNVVGMTWPEVPLGSWDTALLRVEVTASADRPTPYVEVASGAGSDRQYFRSGDAGPRWLNLSFLRGALTGGTRVSLRGEGVAVAAGEATLRLFGNSVNLSGTILVLAPHPDDAEIATFGVYANRNATIVTVTTGNAGQRSYQSVFEDVPDLYHFKGRLRLIDSITVPWLGGIAPTRTFNMGYFDARLADMHDNPGKTVPEMYSANADIGAYLKYNIGSLLPKRSRASTWAHLVEDLETVLKKVKPAVILAPHPQLDSHRDHQFTTIALAEALTRWKKAVTLLLYTNHADQNRYPYGPAGTVASLPPPMPRDVLLDRVYSHPVSPEAQRLKLFALESMHDLRVSPSRLYQLVIGDDRVREPERQDPGDGVSYLRRGPRSNEIFFVYSQDSVKPLVDAFLAEWRRREDR
jgi:LmbE family N-acetylglucosaminyl deacetylase